MCVVYGMCVYVCALYMWYMWYMCCMCGMCIYVSMWYVCICMCCVCGMCMCVLCVWCVFVLVCMYVCSVRVVCGMCVYLCMVYMFMYIDVYVCTWCVWCVCFGKRSPIVLSSPRRSHTPIARIIDTHHHILLFPREFLGSKSTPLPLYSKPFP